MTDVRDLILGSSFSTLNTLYCRGKNKESNKKATYNFGILLIIMIIIIIIFIEDTKRVLKDICCLKKDIFCLLFKKRENSRQLTDVKLENIFSGPNQMFAVTYI